MQKLPIVLLGVLLALNTATAQTSALDAAKASVTAARAEAQEVLRRNEQDLARKSKLPLWVTTAQTQIVNGANAALTSVQQAYVEALSTSALLTAADTRIKALLAELEQVRIRIVPVVGSGTTRTAATCSQTDVQTAVTASANGDTVIIPANSCTWTSGITVADGKGITIKGTGTPNSTQATVGPSASCDDTVITLNNVNGAFALYPEVNDAMMRISCMKIIDEGAPDANAAFRINGTCSSGECPDFRMDNMTFTGFETNTTDNGLSAAVGGINNMFGVFDHNSVIGTTNSYLVLAQIHHSGFTEAANYGDNSWEELEDYGSDEKVFFENNYFSNAGTSENEGSAANYEDQGGGRFTVRYNTFTNMDAINFTFGCHGTESGGRIRSGCRAVEYYGNTYTPDGLSSVGQHGGLRGGQMLAFNNTTDKTGVVANNIYSLSIMRAYSAVGSEAWYHGCYGMSPYDNNEGVDHYTGTIASVSYPGYYIRITVTGSPGWTAGATWVSTVGNPYSVYNVTLGVGSEIYTNGTDSIDIYPAGPGPWTPVAGNSIKILRSFQCLDQVGAGRSNAMSGGNYPTPEAFPAQPRSPLYFWNETVLGGAAAYGTLDTNGVVSVVSPNTGRLLKNRDVYFENFNQAAQTSASSPFDGSTTGVAGTGVGHGTITLRPTSCTVGVAYWATDEGEWNSANGATADGKMYICTSLNTWTASYGPAGNGNTSGLPYTYPHPFTVP